MAKYEGPDDTRSAYEREKRSKSPFKPLKIAGAILALIIVALCVLFAVGLFAVSMGYKPEPANARIVEAEAPDICVVHYDANDARPALNDRVVTSSPTVFAKCKKYKGKHVTLSYDPDTWYISDIKQLK